MRVLQRPIMSTSACTSKKIHILYDSLKCRLFLSPAFSGLMQLCLYQQQYVYGKMQSVGLDCGLYCLWLFLPGGLGRLRYRLIHTTLSLSIISVGSFFKAVKESIRICQGVSRCVCAVLEVSAISHCPEITYDSMPHIVMLKNELLF